MPSYVIKEGGDSRYPNQRKLARKSNGELWCAYYRSDGMRNQIYVAYSVDNGVNWTEEQVTSATETNHQYCPAIVIDSNDVVHLVWYGKGWGTYPTKNQILYNKRTSEGWQVQELVTDANGDQRYPVVVISSNNDVHVIWLGKAWGTCPGYDNIQYRKRTSGGWQTQEAITDVAYSQGGIALAVDSDNNLHLIWHCLGTGTYPLSNQIQYRKRTSGGWQTQELVTDVNAHNSNPCINIDSQNNIHAIWRGKGWGGNPTIDNIRYRKRISGGWQEHEEVTDSGSAQNYVSTTIDSNDDLYAIWSGKGWGSNPTIDNIQYRKRVLGVWGSQSGITNSSTAQTYPNAIRTTYTGFAFIWMNGTTLTYFASDDLNWGEELVFSRVNEKWGW